MQALLRNLIALVFLMPLLCHADAVSSLADKRVLLIYSYHPSFPTSDKVITGLRSAFGENSPVIDIEYMDTKRLYDDTISQHFLDITRYKLSQRQAYDVVISADDHALDFVLTHREELFPNAAAVFLGVNNIPKALSLEDTPWITGVVEAASFIDTLTLAKHLLPERSNIHIVVDSSTTGQTDLNTIKSRQDKLVGMQLQELSLVDNSWSQFTQHVADLGSSDMLLLLSAYRDKHVTEKSFPEALQLLTNNTDVPILHTWEHGIGDGIFGGITVSHKEQGRQAGLMVQRILSGTPVAEIPILAQSPNVPTFDYRVMSSLGIHSSQLPEGSIILFKPVTLWSAYRTEALSALFTCIILLLAAIYLARKNYQTQQLSVELLKQSSFIRLLMDTLPDLVWVKKTDGTFLTCNKTFEEAFGCTEQEIIGKTSRDFMQQPQADIFHQKGIEAIESGVSSIFEEVVISVQSGQKEVLETIKTPVYDTETQEIIGVLGVARNISERKKSEDSLRLAASVFANTVEGVMITTADNIIIEVNKAFSDITGYSHEEALGETPKLLRSGKQDDHFYQKLWQSLNDEGVYRGEFINRRKDGSLFPIWQTITAVKDNTGELTHYVAVFSDISQIKASQEKIQHLAYHDSLTGLPNRLLLKEHLDFSIKRAKRHSQPFTLMYLDLDNFKYINDSFGHSEGDELLCFVAAFLQQSIREEDFVARIGGDEFVLVFHELADSEDAGHLAKKLLDKLLKALPLKHHQVNISASLGLCMYPQDGDSSDELMRNADSAMYRAKRSGRNTFQFYTRELTQTVKERVEIESQLRQAVKNNELLLHYQPQLNLTTGRIEGVEALLRWYHPEHGLIPPDKFIPIAEETGLILPIGEWVLDAAVKQAKVWQEQNIHVGKVAVNIAGQQIQNGDLADIVEQALTTHQLNPNYLALEVTETFMMQHEQTAITQLNLLSDMGIELAIDDFGTGYSSLSYLKQLPIHKLKIDRSFISGIPLDKDDMVISKTVIALGESLNFKIIAEGVETQEQADFLQQVGCHEAQGFLFSKPLPAHELEAYYQTALQQA